MKFNSARFNTYLAAAVLVLVCGCASGSGKKDEKEKAVLTLHLQTDQEPGNGVKHIFVNRDAPIYLNVEQEPFVDSADIDSAAVVDDFGAYSIQLKFDTRGMVLLEQMTSGNQSKRIAVFAKWGKESRWLGCWLIRHRVQNGIFVFTPDASREEAARIVRGLNHAAKDNKKQEKL